MKKSLLIFLPVAGMILLGSNQGVLPDAIGAEGIPVMEIVQDTTFDATAALAQLEEQIAGKENQPAEEVFKNIQILKGFPAKRVLGIMNVAFNQSLGVSCDHCHNTAEWASDEKTEKLVAREMWQMTGTINRELLANIDGLKSETPIVNCTTCHRGDVKPKLKIN